MSHWQIFGIMIATIFFGLGCLVAGTEILDWAQGGTVAWDNLIIAPIISWGAAGVILLAVLGVWR